MGPVKSPRKVVERISCPIGGVCTTGLCVSRLPSEKVFSQENENWDQITPSNSPRARGTTSKFGKDRVHREALFKSANFTNAVRALPDFEERILDENFAPREMFISSNIRIKPRSTLRLKPGQRRRHFKISRGTRIRG